MQEQIKKRTKQIGLEIIKLIDEYSGVKGATDSGAKGATL